MTKSFAVTIGLITAFCSVPAGAQARATITDSRMIVDAGAAADTFLVHTIALHGKVRTEYQGGKNPQAPFGGDGGSVQIMTVADSTITMDFLDPVKKTYVEFQPGAMMRGAQDMLKAMGSGMNNKVTSDSVALDSLGDGGVIAGYSTLHYRTRFSVHMEMAMMGQSMTVALMDTMDLYIAPGAKDPLDTAANARLGQEMKRAFTSSMPFDMSETMTKLSASSARIANLGMPLKTVNSITTSTMGRQRTRRMTTEVLKLERAVVPDSLFQIPADYKKVDPMLRLRPDSTAHR